MTAHTQPVAGTALWTRRLVAGARFAALVYVVIAREDGQPFSTADDRHAELILWDIVEVHLRTSVLDGRAIAETPEEEAAADESTATTAPESDG
jgi:hypothetical protein